MDMHICCHVCMYVHVCVHAYMRVRVRVCMCLCSHACVCSCACVRACVYMCDEGEPVCWRPDIDIWCHLLSPARVHHLNPELSDLTSLGIFSGDRLFLLCAGITNWPACGELRTRDSCSQDGSG